MRKNKKLLLIVIVAILAVSIPVTLVLINRGEEPSNGGSSNTTPDDHEGPVTPSTLTVLSITDGDVFVMKAGTNNWTEARVGMSLEAGDIVKSGDDSNAQITFFDGSTIELEDGTEIEVVALGISDTGSTTIKLKQAIGNTISRVEKLVDSASRYEVETPACVAAVRGSVMQVQVIADGTTWVTNNKGDIWVNVNGVELQIPEGRKCIIVSGQPPQLVPEKSGGGGGGGGGFSPNPDISITKVPDLTQAHEGAAVNYTYTVTNPGNVPLSNVSVTDSNIEVVTYQSGDTNGDGILDTDETWIFTATYNVTAGDPAPLVNTAAAAGNYTGVGTIIAWTTASVDILRPAIALNKTADPVQAQDGDTITYTYTITNPGNTPLSAISLIDDKIEDVTYQSGDTNGNEILDVDETWVFAANYTVTAEDDSPLVNTATVSGADALSWSVQSEDTASVYILRPAIAIDKAAEPAQAHEGDTITYTYTITNAGNTPLFNISVTDDKIEDVTYQSGDTHGDGRLDAGETWIFTASYYVTEEDDSPLVNTATASGTDALSRPVQSEDTASVDILRPAIAMTKAAESAQAHEGDTITYTYAITNASNTPLYDILVTDDMIGTVTYEDNYESGDDDEDEVLDADETWVFAAAYTITAQDDSPLVNSATASGTDALSRSVESEEDTASVYILRPAIAIDKTAEPEQASVEENITYTYTVTNPGNVPLSNVSVTDSNIEDVIYQSGDTNGNNRLDTGETWTFTAVYTVSAEDTSPLVNTATATGADALGRTVTDQASASVTIIQFATIEIQIDTQLTTWILISDNTTGEWAIDEDTGNPVNGEYHEAPATITVAGGHYYSVWVEVVDYGYYYIDSYPEGWTTYVLPDESLAAYGYAAAGSVYTVVFSVPMY